MMMIAEDSPSADHPKPLALRSEVVWHADEDRELFYAFRPRSGSATSPPTAIPSGTGWRSISTYLYLVPQFQPYFCRK